MFLAFTALRDVRFREVSLENECFLVVEDVARSFSTMFQAASGVFGVYRNSFLVCFRL